MSAPILVAFGFYGRTIEFQLPSAQAFDRVRQDLAAKGYALILKVTLLPACPDALRIEQDGRVLFDAETGDIVRVYNRHIVKHDFDTAGASKARELFKREFPGAIFL